MERSPLRTAAALALAATAGVAAAQSSFTIVRPFDGARVREKVKILVPKSSVPAGGYIGVFLDGKLLDAAQPELDPSKSYYQYTLDTKGRKIADGPKKLEMRLYVDYGNTPRIVDTSSVDITVANSSGIKIPSGGISLRYRWTPGSERIYTMRQRNIISAADTNRLDARATSIEQEGEGIRLLYAVDAAYGNGEGLLRMQVIPNRGLKNSEYAYLTTAGSSGPQRYYPSEMAPIYMKVDSTGRELFGAIPDYFGLEGTSGQSFGTSLFAAFPLPVLPSKSVKPGDVWQTAFLMGAIDLENLHGQKSVTQKYPARGEFVGVEWEMGHPCAKIRNSIAQGASALNAKKDTTGNTIEGDKVQLEETIYFALDTRQVIKIIRDITTESKVENAGGFQGGGAAGGAAGGEERGGSRPSGGRPAGGRPGASSPDFSQRAGIGAAQRGGGAPGGPAGGPAGRGGQGGRTGPGGNPGSGQAGQATYFRIRRQQIFTLVK